MTTSAANYVTNLARLLRGDRLLRPLVAVYYVTTHCNLNCAYCEDFGRRRNAEAAGPLPLADALRVLRVVRGGVDHLILTGGEALTYPDIDELVRRARREIGFRHITLLTNGSLLGGHEALLPSLSRLVVSVDSTDAGLWSGVTGVSSDTMQAVLDSVVHYAGRQRELGFRLAVNCVLTPETLPGARRVLELARRHGLLASFSPQAANNWPRYELLAGDEYGAFLRELAAAKRRGAPILGSLAYLRTLRTLPAYACYPTLIPRVLPGGELVYPCWPIEKAGTAHGGRPCSLLEVASWREALERAAGEYGAPPRLCSSCYQQCYAEPSLMQARPLSFLAEWLRYPASRRGSVATYAPG